MAPKALTLAQLNVLHPIVLEQFGTHILMDVESCQFAHMTFSLKPLLTKHNARIHRLGPRLKEVCEQTKRNGHNELTFVSFRLSIVNVLIEMPIEGDEMPQKGMLFLLRGATAPGSSAPILLGARVGASEHMPAALASLEG